MAIEIQETLEKRLLRLLKIENVEDHSLAVEMLFDALAVISKVAMIDDFRELVAEANSAALDLLTQLSSTDLDLLNEIISKRREGLEEDNIDKAQVKVQKLINPSSRKKLAAYFTKSIGLELMAAVTSEYAKSCTSPITLCDPFLGSGLTLTAVLKEVDRSQVQGVRGVEPHPLSALVAYAAILKALEGDFRKVDVRVDDAFKMASRKSVPIFGCDSKEVTKPFKANVILTNPPFTRWELLSPAYRHFLRKFVEALGYSRYVTRAQLNLQIVSLFLMDYVLDKGGLLISVLPASTFYTIYGEAAKKLLKEKYQVNAMVEYDSEPSFSMDSGFKELILIAEKGSTGMETAFVTICRSGEGRIDKFKYILDGIKPVDDRINWVNLDRVSKLWEKNWMVLFGHNELREFLTRLLSKAISYSTVDTWVNCLGKNCIVRGIEMYGPDFFLIPNRYWKIANEKAETVTMEDNLEGKRLEVSREFLVPALRKPELYKHTIEPHVNHYFVTLPPEPLSQLPGDIAEYVTWGERSRTARPAIETFGKTWYSHVWKQIRIKKPFGRMFLPDKIDPSFRQRGVFASFSESLVTASKNFYVVTLGDRLKDEALAAWFNSTIFITYFIVASRQISDNWTRFLEDDYLKMPVINVNFLSENNLTKIGRDLEDIRATRLPPLRHQLGSTFRCKLDMTLLEAIGIENPSNIVNELYSALKGYWGED